MPGPIPPADAGESRFVAFQVGEDVHLRGVINEATNFAGLEALLNKPRRLSLNGVKPSTWNGLRSLVRIMLARGCNEICDVPPFVFEELKLMPELDTQFSVVTMRCKWIDLAMPMLSPPDCALLYQSVAAHALPVSVQRFVEARHHLVSRALSEAMPRHLTIGQFVYDYLAFCVSVVGMLSRQLVAGNEAIRGAIKQLSLRREHLQSVAGALEIPFAIASDESLAAAAYVFGDEVCASLDARSERLRDALFAFSLALDSPDQLASQLTSRDQGVAALREIVALKSEMELAGLRFGSIIQAFDSLHQLEAGLLQYDPGKLTSAAATAIKEALDVMDPLVEDSWADLELIISGELKAYHEGLLAALVLVQGYDLARQVLEHREIESVLPWGSIGFGISEDQWPEAQRALLQQAQKKLVTDQENAAFSYFLSRWASGIGALVSREIEAEPGDVMLF